MPAADERNPWDALDRESSRSFGAFTVYLDLGARRTVREAATIVYAAENAAGKRTAKGLPYGVPQLKKWSQANDWVSRALEYDRHLAREETRSAVAERKKMAARHIKIAKAMQLQVVQKLASMKPEDIKDVTDLTRMAKLSADLERRAHDVNGKETAASVEKDDSQERAKAGVLKLPMRLTDEAEWEKVSTRQQAELAAEAERAVNALDDEPAR
jgi:hypothetical protein